MATRRIRLPTGNPERFPQWQCRLKRTGGTGLSPARDKDGHWKIGDPAGCPLQGWLCEGARRTVSFTETVRGREEIVHQSAMSGKYLPPEGEGKYKEHQF